MAKVNFSSFNHLISWLCVWMPSVHNLKLIDTDSKTEDAKKLINTHKFPHLKFCVKYESELTHLPDEL